MDNQYTTKHVIDLFAVSHETVKNWSHEFADYLSPSATPPAGTKRVFTDDDLRVLALVSDYKKRGLTYADAHMALKSNQRGEIPSPSSLDRLPAAVQDMIVHFRVDMEKLQAQLEAERANTNKALGQVELLKDQLAEKERQMRELLEENARLKIQTRSND
jgi:DNA-binding transcriptional MerR regulator